MPESESHQNERLPLDPDAETMRSLGYELIDRIVDHLTTLSDQRVGRRGTGAELAQLVDEPLPEQPGGIQDSFAFFFDRVVTGMTRVNHPRFHAHIPCPSSFAGAMGEMLAAGTNPFVGSWLGGGTLCSLEITVLRWICEMLGYPNNAAGVLTSGGSMANLIGLASARAEYDSDLLSNGRIYVSVEGHASVRKAARLLGFSDQTIQTIGVDDRYRMKTAELVDAINSDLAAGKEPFVVVANAGTTNTGSIDPLPEIADVCQRMKLWLHVDAAYGGFAAIDSGTEQAGSPEGTRRLLAGMERADSLTLDPHKWLYCPLGIGCVLVQRQDSLKRAFATEGHYLKDIPVEEVNFYERGPELSRPARVLAVWMVIRSSGRAALAHQITEDIRLAQLAAALLRADDRFEVIDPDLSVVAFRHRSREGESEANRANRDTALMEATLADGELMLSSTLLNGINTLRLVVMNHRTTERDVHRSVRRIQELST
ncbi:aminotransferase class V-fold PLP-dependent enzyme [Rubripirellula sp.]|nr:aminotransferase class V-fold PLP-dependent enzyme [Rubripirellula sp.]